MRRAMIHEIYLPLTRRRKLESAHICTKTCAERTNLIYAFVVYLFVYHCTLEFTFTGDESTSEALDSKLSLHR